MKLSPPINEFRRTAQSLCKTLHTYGENIAGGLWLGGSFVQLGISLFQTLSLRQLFAAGADISASASVIAFGHKDIGIRVGCVVGEIGTTATLWPDLVKGDPHTLPGFVLSTAVKTFGFFSPELTKRFEQSDNSIWRQTLGSPRRICLLNAAVFLPIVWHNTPMHPEIAVPYSIWTLGYLVASMSKSELSKTRAKKSTHKLSME